MSKEQNKENAADKKEDIAKFGRKVRQLTKSGYTVLDGMESVGFDYESFVNESFASYANAPERATGIDGAASMFDRGVTAVPVENVGTPNLGYIPWGPKNDLPNYIYNAVGALPYTASALKYLVDTAVALGPQLMYSYAVYQNGEVKTKMIPYSLAGILLRNRIRELESQKMTLEGGKGDAEDSKITSKGSITFFQSPEADTPDSDEADAKSRPGTLEYEIETLKEDYEVWQRDSKEIETFLENNNLHMHYEKCMTDDAHLDIYFPIVGLTQGRVRESWEPKIASVGFLPALCSRMEKMDKNRRINYIFYSERWRDKQTSDMTSLDIIAYPSVSPENRMKELNDLVNANKKTPLTNRPSWVACPTYHPSMMKPYYPQPAWWSIFPSGVYSYASTLIIDKSIAKQNATMFNKLIFVHKEYLDELCRLAGAEEPEERRKVYDSLKARINSFLRNRNNNGKNLIAFSFNGPSGAPIKGVEIVDVPIANTGARTKTELEEISSIIFFAYGVHPALIGAVPGKSGTSSGSVQRELAELKMLQMEHRQRAYINFLQFISRFNKWDKHARWVIGKQVLSTLDKSPSGLAEVEDGNLT